MNGNKENLSLDDLFFLQVMNQKKLIKKGLYEDASKDTKNVVHDNPKLASYHMLQLMSELGEVLDSDKRWKNFRNDKNDSENKIEEIADCYIVLMNITMFSGIDGETMENEILKKLIKVNNRINEQ